MKRILCFVLALLLLLSMGGCATFQDDGKLTIVTTTFAEYDWVRQILGQAEAELILLTDNGTELHSYQPTPEDIVTIAQCDLFIYTASEQSPWLRQSLETAANPKRLTLDLGAELADKALYEEHDHTHSDHQPALDQHHWLSPKNAILLSEKIAQKIMEADPQNKELYRKNADAYQTKLAALDQQYQAVFGQGATLIFADRFPFRYLAEDYGITCHAAFPGCSAETNASFETVLFLAEKLKEKNLPAVLTVDEQNKALAQTVIQTAGVEAEILTVNSMQSVTAQEIAQGETYYSTMKKNIETFRKALS